MILCQSGRFGSAPPPVSTSYANSGGTGSRNGIITISTVVIANNGSATALLNGTIVESVYYWNFANGNGTGWHKFDFGTAKVIDEFKWYQDNASTHGTWRMEGSNDDSAYTQVGSDFTLGGSTVSTYSITNSTAYRYYRLRHMSGSRSDSPYLREIEFKISA